MHRTPLRKLAKRIAEISLNLEACNEIRDNKNIPSFEEILVNDETDCLEEKNIERAISRPFLGSFTPPHSPAVIALYENNLKSFYLGAMNDVFGNNWQRSNIDRKKYADIVVYKTFYHELFHYYSWYIREIISKEPKDHLIEEALATALSWHKVQKRFKRHITTSADKAFVDRIYQYKGAGYRDWVNYNTASTFQTATHDYLIGNTHLSQGLYVDFRLISDPKVMSLASTFEPQNTAYYLNII